MSGPRVRTRSIGQAGGTATWYDGILSPKPSSSLWSEECGDITGNFDGVNPFTLTRTNNLAWALYGRMRANGYGWTYNGYVKTSTPGNHFNTTSVEPTDNETLSEALARTNPNRVIVDTPVFLAELREIPRLVSHFAQLGMKQFRDKPISSVASNYLTWEYGVSTYMRDLYGMMQFQNHVEQRLRELKNLQSGQAGLGRKWTVWKDTVVGSPWVTYASPLYQESNMVSAIWATERKKWASTRWVPINDISSFNDDHLRRLANRIVFGRDISFSTLWEAMPWSWMIDWFSNIGDLASLSRNTLPVKHDGSCVMQSTRTRVLSVTPVSGPGLGYFSASAGKSETRVTLRRTPWTFGPLPEFNLPFLSGKQLSILSAISVTRRR